MIGRLRGILVTNRAHAVCIDVNGVGYEVVMTPRDVAGLPGIGEEIVVHTHTYVREDEMTLYGFGSEGDRDLFRVLLGASGVGPKVAQSMLASMDAQQIIMAIVNEDPEALTVAPGVGKRGAQKIVLELAPKLAGKDIDVVGGGDLVSVRQALEGLGYSTTEINGVVSGLNPDDPIEVQVKAALQQLGRSRKQ